MMGAIFMKFGRAPTTQRRLCRDGWLMFGIYIPGVFVSGVLVTGENSVVIRDKTMTVNCFIWLELH